MCNEERCEAKSIYKVATVYVGGTADYECSCVCDRPLCGLCSDRDGVALYSDCSGSLCVQQTCCAQGNDFFCHAVRTNSETAFEGIVRSLRAGR